MQHLGVDNNLHDDDLVAQRDGREILEQQFMKLVLNNFIGLMRLAAAAVLSLGEFLSCEATLAKPRVPAGENIQCV